MESLHDPKKTDRLNPLSTPSKESIAEKEKAFKEGLHDDNVTENEDSTVTNKETKIVNAQDEDQIVNASGN